MRALAHVLALLGPLAVLGGSWALLDSLHDADEAQQARNAGHVVNARVLELDTAQAMDRLLATRRPKVVVLGPSYANTDVKTDLLAARLGISRDEIVLLSVPNSVGAHWYAVLKYRLFEAGHRPALVVVVSGLQSMLLTTPLTEASFVNLEVQLPEGGDPVVDRLVGQEGALWWGRLREQRGLARNLVFDALRGVTASTLFGVDRRQARAALDAVFDDALVDMDLYQGTTNIAGGELEPQRYYSPDMLPAPDDGFVPVITELVREHGGRTVWVRPPMSPFIPQELDDVVLPGVQERTIALVDERGGDFLDMRALPMSSAMFRNEDHMNEEGSRRFSDALAVALQDLDALHPEADPERAGPLAVTSEGPVPRIGAGERAVFHVGGWPEVRGTFGVDVATSGPARVTVAGVPVGLAFDPVLPGYAWSAALDAPGEGPFDVVVEAGDAPVELLGLALGRRRGRTFLVGDVSVFEGHAVHTLGQSRIEGGVLVDTSVRPTYGREPVTPPLAARDTIDLPSDVAAYDTSRWAFLSDEALKGETTFGSRCSPLRITEDGRMLGPANVPCLEVMRQGHGRSCHTLDRIFFTAPDGTDPATNGRIYRLALDPARTCDDAAWIYPIDTLTLTLPREGVASLEQGGRWLRVGARYISQRKTELVVTLVVDGTTVFEETVDGRDFKTKPMVREIDPPVPPTAEVVEVHLESKNHVFYLLNDVSLSERPPQ
ncbi:MAG: hypothetical protein H6738_18285 [Alphaproteobacteria bacterium]|nr:hypothetical protein [Alphaproteobacteria bacterium]